MFSERGVVWVVKGGIEKSDPRIESSLENNLLHDVVVEDGLEGALEDAEAWFETEDAAALDCWPFRFSASALVFDWPILEEVAAERFSFVR